jgi:branched-chain amino acid transport system ATP-binding protein
VDFEVMQGQVVTLIGNNGAGKTTTLNAICGILSKVSGEINFRGTSITRWPPDRVVSLGISQVPEGRRIFPHLTVEENLLMGAFRRSRQARRRTIEGDLGRVYELFPILRERRRSPGGSLSGGQQQMLAIGRGLMARPRLLLLDEPSLGLSPVLVQQIMEIIRQINAGGTTVLLVEQNARLALQIASYGYVLEKGRVSLSGSAKELMTDSKVRKIYLGESQENL